MGPKIMRASAFAVRLAIACIFAFAGVMKTLDPSAFLKAINNYQLVHYSIAVLLVFYLPSLEIICSAGLMLKRLREGAALLLILMTLVFIVALISAWGRGLNIECGCFGFSEGTGHYAVALTRDLIILAGLCGLPWLERKSLGNQS